MYLIAGAEASQKSEALGLVGSLLHDQTKAVLLGCLPVDRTTRRHPLISNLSTLDFVSKRSVPVSRTEMPRTISVWLTKVHKSVYMLVSYNVVLEIRLI